MVSNADAVEWSAEMFKLWIEEPLRTADHWWQPANYIRQARDIKQIAKNMPHAHRMRLAEEFEKLEKELSHDLKQAADWLRRERPEPDFTPEYIRSESSSK